MSSPKVFLPKVVERFDDNVKAMRPAFDFSAAAQFGSLVEILGPEDDPLFLGKITKKITEALADFKENDYFLAVGNPAVIAICAGVILRKQKTLNLLQWDRKLKIYVKMEVEL